MKKVLDKSLKNLFFLCLIFNFLIILFLTLNIVFYGGLGFGYVDKELPKYIDFLRTIWVLYPIKFFEFLNLLNLINSLFFFLILITLLDSIILTMVIVIIKKFLNIIKS